MGKISQQVINDIQEGTICKAVSGDYVIYKRSWLMDHIDQEAVLWKAAKDFKESFEHRRQLLEKLKGEIEDGKKTQNSSEMQ